MTGKFDCGPLGDSGAPGRLAVPPGAPERELHAVNGYSGNWSAGTSTCIGAGGAIFWSDQYDLDVYGGKYVTCNHGLFGAGQDLPGNVVERRIVPHRPGRALRVEWRRSCSPGLHAFDPCISTQALHHQCDLSEMGLSKTNTWVDGAPR